MVARKRRDTTPAELIELYLCDVKERSSDSHYRNTASQLRRLMKRLQSFEPEHVLRYRSWRKSKRKSNATCNAEIKALSTFFEWCRGAKLLDENPIDGIRPLPVRACDVKKVRRAMTEAEIVRFLKASEDRDKDLELDFGLTRLWRTLIETTLRWTRCVSLTTDDIGTNLIHLKPIGGKSGRARTIPIRPALAAELRAHAVGPLVFVTPRGEPWTYNNHGVALRAFYDTLRRAQIPNPDQAGRSLDLHALRWTAISRLARLGVDGAVIQKVAGHSSRAMTMHYTDFDDGHLIRTWREKVWKPGKHS